MSRKDKNQHHSNEEEFEFSEEDLKPDMDNDVDYDFSEEDLIPDFEQDEDFNFSEEDLIPDMEEEDEYIEEDSEKGYEENPDEEENLDEEEKEYDEYDDIPYVPYSKNVSINKNFLEAQNQEEFKKFDKKEEEERKRKKKFLLKIDEEDLDINIEDKDPTLSINPKEVDEDGNLIIMGGEEGFEDTLKEYTTSKDPSNNSQEDVQEVVEDPMYIENEDGVTSEDTEPVQVEEDKSKGKKKFSLFKKKDKKQSSSEVKDSTNETNLSDNSSDNPSDDFSGNNNPVEEKGKKKSSKMLIPVIVLASGLVVGGIFLAPKLLGENNFVSNITEKIPFIGGDDNNNVVPPNNNGQGVAIIDDTTNDPNNQNGGEVVNQEPQKSIEEIEREQNELEIEGNILHLLSTADVKIEGNVVSVKGVVKEDDLLILNRLARDIQKEVSPFLRPDKVEGINNIRVSLDTKDGETYTWVTETKIIDYIAQLTYEDRHSSQMWWDTSEIFKDGSFYKVSLDRKHLYVPSPHPVWADKAEWNVVVQHPIDVSKLEEFSDEKFLVSFKRPMLTKLRSFVDITEEDAIFKVETTNPNETPIELYLNHPLKREKTNNIDRIYADRQVDFQKSNPKYVYLEDLTFSEKDNDYLRGRVFKEETAEGTYYIYYMLGFVPMSTGMGDKITDVPPNANPEEENAEGEDNGQETDGEDQEQQEGEQEGGEENAEGGDQEAPQEGGEGEVEDTEQKRTVYELVIRYQKDEQLGIQEQVDKIKDSFKFSTFSPQPKIIEEEEVPEENDNPEEAGMTVQSLQMKNSKKSDEPISVDIINVYKDMVGLISVLSDYAADNDGNYPTYYGQPSYNIPQPIDMAKISSELEEKGIETNTNQLNHWVEFTGNVWISTVDAPSNIKIEDGKLKWDSVKNVDHYKVYRVVKDNNGMEKLESVTEDNLKYPYYIFDKNDNQKDTYVVRSVDKNGLKTAASGIGYKGIKDLKIEMKQFAQEPKNEDEVKTFNINE